MSERGDSVTVFDSEMYGCNPRVRLNLTLSRGLSRVEALRANLSDTDLNSGYYRYVSGDIRDYDAVMSLVAGGRFDVVLHLAELVGIPACSADPRKTQSINFEGTINVIDAVAATGGKTRLIWPSSSSVYFKSGRECSEESPTPDPEILDPYAKTKLLVEKHIAGLIEGGTDLDCVILRPATVGGLSVRMRLDLLTSTIVYDLLTNGRFVIGNPDDRRAFVHMDDLTDMYVSLIEGLHWENGTYNVGHLNGSKINFVREICALLGLNPNEVVSVDDSVGDRRDLTINSQLAEVRLKYFPKKGLPEIVLPMAQLLKGDPKVFSRISSGRIDPEFTNAPQLT